MLEVKQLSVSFGAVRALDAVSLVVPRGEVTAVIGANGAGKSTLLEAIAMYLEPSGNVQCSVSRALKDHASMLPPNRAGYLIAGRTGNRA
jgi:ABC-type branched-subunit amino acid transport system ATPase component